jgi:nucleoside-triphosphatase THEP1
MQDADFTEGDSFSDKVQVNLDVLGSLMLNQVGGEVDNTKIISIDQCGAMERTVKLLQKLS